MKKFVAIILLSCLLCTLMGYYFVFRINLCGIRSEMRLRLRNCPSKDVMVLVFDKEEFKKLEWENDLEFRYNNEMYDVIETSQKEGTFIIHCLADKKERALLEEYQKIAQKNTNAPIQTSLLKLIQTQFIVSGGESLNRPQKTIKTVLCGYSFSMPEYNGHPLDHPPRVC